MPINPLENIIYVNQNMQVAASKQLDFQGKVEFQNLIASVITNNKEKEVEDIVDLNEDVKIKEDLEHYRQNSEESLGEKETEEKAVIKNAKKHKKNKDKSHLLDIVV